MASRVMVHRDARKFLDDLPGARRRRIIDALQRLGDDPPGKREKLDTKRLKGGGGRRDVDRLGVGDYRVLSDGEGETIRVTEVFHRGRGFR